VRQSAPGFFAPARLYPGTDSAKPGPT